MIVVILILFMLENNVQAKELTVFGQRIKRRDKNRAEIKDARRKRGLKRRAEAEQMVLRDSLR